MAKDNYRDGNYYYTLVLTFLIGSVAMGVAIYNWSYFATLGRTISLSLAGAGLYCFAIILIEGLFPDLRRYTCPKCGGPVGRASVAGGATTDDVFAMLLISIFSVFGTFHCGRCGQIPASELPLKQRLMAALRSLRWLAFGIILLSAIGGVLVFMAMSSRH
jgi:hypothetical protein